MDGHYDFVEKSYLQRLKNRVASHMRTNIDSHNRKLQCMVNGNSRGEHENSLRLQKDRISLFSVFEPNNTFSNLRTGGVRISPQNVCPRFQFGAFLLENA